MADWELLLTDASIATMCAGSVPYGTVENAALAIADGRIAWLGPQSTIPAGKAQVTRSMAGRWLTPALIDCHTHLAFAGNRAAEFEKRLAGASYEDIAREGGGIMSTVRATRAACEDSLLQQTCRRLRALRRDGVATVEIKSGYGLDLETELKLLRVARAASRATGIPVSATFLGAHAIPAEYRGKSNDYIELVCSEMLPAVAENHLADAVDAYCETIAFSSSQVARVFETASSLGLPVKLHADQLSDSGGAELAASFSALSADHLEYTSLAGVRALAGAGTVAVLLPGAFLTLRETRQPPIQSLRDHAVSIAIATDCNPGTSPICSLRTSMSLATSLFRLTPEECLAGVTRNAAAALGLSADRGTLEIGKRADIAVWDIDHPNELSYWMGLNELSGLLVGGKELPN
ncbi:MAG: imidazolonepropionase [Gammaproteobacteria bacterium]|nr:imidazolonepropionase [Gammaproteobacteria bacterium]MDH4314011.1 imidazolonepropionase [Gammaproteobacteria bacterium]MDH5214933.1 imidazolonepropionase [Gammaproteobacteria bacterium]